MLTKYSRGALLASAVAFSIAGAAAGIDPFARVREVVEPEPKPLEATFTKTLITPPELPPDPQWAAGVKLMVAARSNDWQGCTKGGGFLINRVPLTASIDEAGRVRAITDSPFPVGRCIAKKIEQLVFAPPPPGSTAEVGLTIDLLPQPIDGREPLVVGPLDKELIRKVIHANRQQIRYCYEMQLMKRPDLAGKVAVKFVVAATGAVASSNVAQSTVGSSELENCVAARVKTWQFPKPKGGGIAIVMYPFVFSPNGK